jgi:hypothetical protein
VEAICTTAFDTSGSQSKRGEQWRRERGEQWKSKTLREDSSLRSQREGRRYERKEGERRAMEEQDSARRQQPEESAGGEEIREESGLPSQWPLFGSPTLTTIRVTSYRDKGGTIYFVVQPTLEGFRWIIEKTYDDFAHLHKSLVAYGISRAPNCHYRYALKPCPQPPSGVL